MIFYKIDKDTFLKCVDFARQCTVTNIEEYYRRNQNSIEKVENDIVVGKCGEFALYNFLKVEKNIDVDYPDLNIYDYKNKSHDYDIISGYGNFSVKTQRKVDIDKYGKSILFQKNYINAIKNKVDKNHYLAYCIFYDSGLVQIERIIPFKDILNMLEKPKLKKLRENKYAIYFKE